jgi:hypothetical protein
MVATLPKSADPPEANRSRCRQHRVGSGAPPAAIWAREQDVMRTGVCFVGRLDNVRRFGRHSWHPPLADLVAIANQS